MRCVKLAPSIFLAFLIAIVTIFGLWSIVNADTYYTIETWDFSDGAQGWVWEGLVDSTGEFVDGTAKINFTTHGVNSYGWLTYYPPVTSATVHAGDIFTFTNVNMYTAAGRFYVAVSYTDTTSLIGSDYYSWYSYPVTYTLTVPEGDDGKTIVNITFFAQSAAEWGEGWYSVDDISRLMHVTTPTTPTVYGETCPTVLDHHFTGIITDAWQLSSGATISDSVLTLPELDYARQNLTLQANKTYNAVISVTNLNESDAILTLILGGTDQNLTITGTGIYTTVLHTPASLAGPILYTIKNDPPEEYLPIFDPIIEIGWTCLYLSDDQQDCLAPVNGEFSSSNYWDWYRGADWESAGQYALLPDDTQGLIISTENYSMPEISAGEYLLLSFDAKSPGEGGLIGARTKTTGITHDFIASVYPNYYTYEDDLSSFAEQDVTLHFANPGIGGYEGYTSTNDAIIDNICVFISDHPASLPTITDPDAPPWVDLGFNYTSCANIDGIWAGFGVNMAQYRATYAAGASVWDPIGWVPWLVAAIFVTLADWSCMFMAAFVALVNILEYIINNIINIYDWARRSAIAFLAWIPGFVSLLWGYITTYLFNLNGLRVLLNIIITAWNAIWTFFGWLIGWWVDSFIIWPWNNIIIPLAQKIWDYLSTISLFQLIFFAVLNFVMATWSLLYTLFWLIWENIIGMLLLPVDFFWAFYYGINEPSFAEPFGCSGANFWCLFFAGVELINLTVSHSVIYPIFIGGIIITTVVVAWVNIKELFSVNMK